MSKIFALLQTDEEVLYCVPLKINVSISAAESTRFIC